jgi:hypothetical protein
VAAGQLLFGGAVTLQVPSHFIVPATAFFMPHEFAGLQEAPRFIGFGTSAALHVLSHSILPVFVWPHELGIVVQEEPRSTGGEGQVQLARSFGVVALQEVPPEELH